MANFQCHFMVFQWKMTLPYLLCWSSVIKSVATHSNIVVKIVTLILILNESHLTNHSIGDSKLVLNQSLCITRILSLTCSLTIFIRFNFDLFPTFDWRFTLIVTSLENVIFCKNKISPLVLRFFNVRWANLKFFDEISYEMFYGFLGSILWNFRFKLTIWQFQCSIFSKFSQFNKKRVQKARFWEFNCSV